MKGTSKELQEISLIGFIKDPYLLGKCITVLKDSFYENPEFRIIFTCLKSYYNKFTAVPSQKELSLLIVDTCDKLSNGTEELNKESILTTLDNIYKNADKISSDGFIYDQVAEFIRRNNIEESLGKIMDYMKGGDIDLNSVANDLASDISVSLSSRQNHLYNLSDVESIKDVREEALGDINNPMLIKFFIEAVNKRLQYKALTPGTLNMVSAAPGTGKTTLMINQGMYAAQQGFKVLHVFLGDMSNYDGLLRYLSNLTGVPTSKLVDLSVTDLEKFVTKNNMTGVLSNIYIASYAQGELTSTQLIDEITEMQANTHVHFDMIIIDYDENISKDDESIYESGGLIYNKLGLFAVVNKSVVFIVSQPKQQYWSDEIIPLEAAAESSKKQKIIDTMFTLGKSSRKSSVGSFFIAKNRRGETGSIMRVRIDGSNTRIEHITEREFNETRKSEKGEAKTDESE